MNNAKRTLSEESNAERKDVIPNRGRSLTGNADWHSLTRSDELRLGRDINLGTHYRLLAAKYSGSDCDAQVAKELLTVIQGGVGLYDVLCDHWELDDQITLGDLLSETTVNILLGGSITNDLSDETEQRLSDFYKEDAEKKIDELAFSCASLPSLFSDEQRKIKYLSDEAQLVLSSDSLITSNIRRCKEQFERISDAYQRAQNELADSNMGLVYTYTVQVLREEEKKQNDRWEELHGIPDSPEDGRKHKFFPDHLGKIVWDGIHDFYEIPTSDRKPNRGKHVDLIEDCVETAVTEFYAAMKAFSYRKGTNQPPEVDQPFIAYFSVAVKKRVNGFLQDALLIIGQEIADTREDLDEDDSEEPNFTSEDLDSSVPSDADQKEIERYRERLLRLNELEKMILRKRHKGKSVADIAEILDLPLGSVWGLWKMIEFKLSDHFDDPAEFYRSISKATLDRYDQKDRQILYDRYCCQHTYEQIALDLRKIDTSKQWTRQRVSKRFRALEFDLKESYGLLQQSRITPLHSNLNSL